MVRHAKHNRVGEARQILPWIGFVQIMPIMINARRLHWSMLLFAGPKDAQGLFGSLEAKDIASPRLFPPAPSVGGDLLKGPRWPQHQAFEVAERLWLLRQLRESE
jgi:hypothetical protein